jgi:hypothetical protein
VISQFHPVEARRAQVSTLAADDPTGKIEFDAETPLEARLSSRLRHPNMVSSLEIGHRNGSVNFVFELASGAAAHTDSCPTDRVELIPGG